jgi:hypothetical protein
MTNLLSALLPRKSPKGATRPAPQARPELERLEGRQMLTVTPHGGAVLPNVKVQALYLGSDWLDTSPGGYGSQKTCLDGFLSNVVNSSYMDMLSRAGYGAGRGSAAPGSVLTTIAYPPWYQPRPLDKSKPVTDDQIFSALVNQVNGGWLQKPDNNTLYVVYVEDNVAVQNGSATSSGFQGYHGARVGFVYQARSPWNPWPTLPFPVTIRYAVVPYPGGTVGNSSRPGLSDLDNLTRATAQEIADAVTDPDKGYSTRGWYDDASGGEVGDISANQVVHLNGYAVPRVSDKNDQPMTPAGAVGRNPVHFVLGTDGSLYILYGANPSRITTAIASLSGQGIDNDGYAMVDVVTTDGRAFEYHETLGTYLASGVKSARAGQGVSYVLFTDGTLREYKDSSGSWSSLGAGVSAIDAGTDKAGVNMVTVVTPSGTASEVSDSAGWRSLGSGIRAISAGQQGIMGILYANGNAYSYNEATGVSSYLTTQATAVTAGTNRDGNFLICVVNMAGWAYAFDQTAGMSSLSGSVVSIGKAHAGVVDAVFTTGKAWAHDLSWNHLIDGAQAAA